MQILYFTPFVLECDRHLKMLEIQHLQAQLLKQRLGKEGLEVSSIAVFDKLTEEYAKKAYSFCFDQMLGPECLEGVRGIRRPTDLCIRTVSRKYISTECYLLRIIQDCFISDFNQIVEGILTCIKDQKQIGGSRAQTNNIHSRIDSMGLQTSNQYDYVEGCFMLASLFAWQQFYLPMPAEITHYCDDSIMSQWCFQNGWKISPIEGFMHLHNADEFTLDVICKQLRGMPIRTLTEMCAAFHWPQTDKNSIHSYLEIYDVLFKPLQMAPVRLLEIGVDKGGSLALWAKYFSNNNSEIIGIDTNPQAVINDSRVQLYRGDATSLRLISKIEGLFDIIIDDGSHNVEDQLKTFYLLHERLKDNGIYVIEDMQSDADVLRLKRMVEGFEVVDLRSVKGRYDDVLMVYRKRLSSKTI